MPAPGHRVEEMFWAEMLWNLAARFGQRPRVRLLRRRLDRRRQWREVGVGAQILRDLGVTSIRNLSSTEHAYLGLSGFGIEIAASENFE